MSKLAIVVGHTRAAKGAFSSTLNASEYDWNNDLAKKMVAVGHLKIEMMIFYRDNGGIQGAYRAGDRWGADAFVELHFNASHNTTSTGTGILYQTPRSRRWAQELYNEISGVLKLKPWPASTGGVCTPLQASGRQERGKGSLTASAAPSALTEPFFGSNPSDSAKARDNKDRMAAAMVRAAAAFFRV